MAGGGRTGLIDLVHLALNDPGRAVVAADEVLGSSPIDSDAITALRARGLARRQLGEFDASEIDLVAALDRADELGDDELWAGAGLSLAGTWVFQGKVDEAKALLGRCIERASGESHIEAIYQLGTTCAQAGDLDAAVKHYARALPLIRELDRPTWEGNLLGNRGVMNIYRGHFDEAIADLDRAIELHADQGPSMYSLHRGNKAYALQLRGDIAQAIDLYEENEQFQDEHDLPKLMYSQRCTAYLAAGMYEDAMELAQQAHRFHTENQAVLGAIEALLPGAEAALALENSDLAQQLAQAAIALDAEDSFPALTARAHLALIESRLQNGTSLSADVTKALELAEALVESDNGVSARASLTGARAALASGQTDQARSMLGASEAVIARAPLHLQIERAAVIARTGLDDDAILAAVFEGLATFDNLVAGVAAYDVRYKAARHASELAAQGLQVLLGAGDLGTAVLLVERARAGALLLDSRDVEVADQKLRPDESHLVWVEHEGKCLCMAASASGIVTHDCGPLDIVDAAVERHHFAHRQLAHRMRLSEASRLDLLAAAETADSELSDLLVPQDLADRVVLNPSARVSRVLWAALPALADRLITVAPSLAVSRRALPAVITRIAVLGATELPHVPREVEQIAAGWGTVPMLDPREEILEQLAGVDVLHAAGHFVADGSNPLFSALPLGQLRLRGHDYLQLSPAPTIAVLSACASGQGESVAGAQVGFSSAALAAGTASVIVTQTIVEDAPGTVRTMTALHEALQSGSKPAEALRDLRLSASREDRSSVATFGVVGAGW